MIHDKDFITSKNVPGPTKEEIRCLVMCKSEVSPTDIVVDIGCGTGGLTLEFAIRARKVYAIDKNIESINLTSKNLKKHSLEEKTKIIHDDAIDALKNIDQIDILIIGGSGGNLSLIIEEGYKKLKNNGRIIITSILLETPVEAIKTLNALKMTPEIVNISISKGEVINRGTMMFANNPITIIKCKKIDIN